MWEEREKKAIFEIFSQQPCSELYSPVSLVDIEPRERDDVTVLRAQCEAAQTGSELTTDPSAVKMSDRDSQVGALSQFHIFSPRLINTIQNSAQQQSRQESSVSLLLLVVFMECLMMY